MYLLSNWKVIFLYLLPSKVVYHTLVSKVPGNQPSLSEKVNEKSLNKIQLQ